MKSCLSIIRWSIASFLCTILAILIIVGIPLASLSKVVSNSDNIKNWIIESNIYEDFSSILVDQLSNWEGEGIPEMVNLEDKEMLQKSLDKIVPKVWLKDNVETVIDSIYIWLEGNSDIPEFEIDLSGRKGVLVDEVVTIFQSQFDDLPECTEEEVEKMTAEGEDFNPADATCIPPGIDISDTTKLEEDFTKVLGDSEILDDDKISSDEIIKLDEKVIDNVHRGYSIFKNLPKYITIAIVLVSLIIFIFIPRLSPSFIVIGIVWVVTSLILMIAAYLQRNQLHMLYLDQLEKLPLEQLNIVRNTLSIPFELANTAIQNEIRQFSFIWLVLGIIFIFGGILLRFSKRRYYVRDDHELFGPEDSVGQKKHDQESDISRKDVTEKRVQKTAS